MKTNKSSLILANRRSSWECRHMMTKTLCWRPQYRRPESFCKKDKSQNNPTFAKSLTMYPSVRTRGSRSETKKHKILWLLSIGCFQSSTYWCEIYHLHKGKVSKCSPERAHYKGRDQPLSDIAGGSTSQLEPGKWQNREENILRRVEGGQDLGRGDGNHIPHPDHALHPLRELLDDLDAVESLAK